MSVTINRQWQSDISVIAGKLLGLVRMHARVPTIFSIQETKSWDVPNLSVPGHVCYGSKSGFAALLVSDQLCTIRRSWRFEERHWEWQDEKSPMMRHGSVVCPTMFLASLNIKTAFDGARPRHVAKIVESHDKHGWLIAAFLREMS